MPTTSPLNAPYPAPTGANNVPADIKALAEWADDQIEALAAAVTAAAIPAGTMAPYGGSAAPSGWVLADGTAISRAANPKLFTAIGTTYGIGDGATTFNVPNAKGRALVGLDITQTEFNTRGKTGGTKAETLTAAQIPAHSHPITDPGHAHTQNLGQANTNVTPNGGTGIIGVSNNSSTSTNPTGITVQNNTGGGGSHNNLQPYLTTNYIIKAG